MADAAAEAVPPMSPASAGGDLSQGYCVEVHVLPDGAFGVVGPEPLETEEEQGESPQTFPSIGEALKGLLAIVREHPVAQDAGAQMAAGFQEG